MQASKEIVTTVEYWDEETMLWRNAARWREPIDNTYVADDSLDGNVFTISEITRNTLIIPIANLRVTKEEFLNGVKSGEYVEYFVTTDDDTELVAVL